MGDDNDKRKKEMFRQLYTKERDDDANDPVDDDGDNENEWEKEERDMWYYTWYTTHNLFTHLT